MKTKNHRSAHPEKMADSPVDQQLVTLAREELLRWFRGHARDFPWRRTRDPYAIWVSEIMLQQTTTQVVEPYFRRFLERFPTLESLASADESDVLKIWEGLGYYRRAQNLHKTARILRTEFGGQFPRDPAVLMRLPGIGRYTAGAILSLAFNQCVPILEANTRRLFRRWLGGFNDGTPLSDRVLWQVAEMFLAPRRARRINLALMDVGSVICLPKAPLCEQCPLQSTCQTFQNRLPVEQSSQKRQSYTLRHEVAFVVVWKQRLLVQRRSEGRWAGLWEFPRILLQEGGCDVPTPEQIALPELVRQTGLFAGLEPLSGHHFARLRHQVTRFRIVLDGFLIRVSGKAKPHHSDGQSELAWMTLDALEGLPMPAPIRRMLRPLRSALGSNCFD
ncbi:A/G-specific adenine glycosylase [Thermogutta terrifontis]|uniref:Adenine DNA glycosylase n=1 Tax=Thermogutta terrifontis TaxID=1331910 RepID=A0A286RE40_9BACT|nr:A/G-specific adenine glycosylase [Thermogutta terrifontis]ASV74235.1 A/G-specific adenine glycosylase [Thermogutta terrifontis]